MQISFLQAVSEYQMLTFFEKLADDLLDNLQISLKNLYNMKKSLKRRFQPFVSEFIMKKLLLVC